MARKSPFTNRQLSRIVVLWAQHQSLTKVRREFAKEFHLAKHPRLVPSMTVFRNTITRFNETASAKPNSGGGSKMSVRTPQNILRVKDAIDEDKTLSVRALSLQLDIDQTTVWRILRKDLMMFPYKAKTTNLVLDWLQSKFGDSIISGRTQRPCPAKSPCLAPNDYWLWSVCLQEIRRVKPASLEELKEVVNNFCESLDPDEVRKAVRHIRRRAQACFEAEGGHFEHKLKKKNNNLEE